MIQLQVQNLKREIEKPLELAKRERLDANLVEFRPREHPRMFDWAIENVVNDQGRHYDHAAYPHLGAPGGPMDAWDDIHVREIAEQFATRLGKSFLAQCGLLYTACVDPAPMLMASESERSLKRINARTYEMIYKSPVSAFLRHKSTRMHKQDMIEFAQCPCHGAWARSAGTLADMNIKVGVANEYDKEGWSGFATSTEGAPPKLFSDRFKDYWSVRKIIWESTPTVKGSSRVESKRMQGTNCRYEVPCPHCKKYRVLPSTPEDVQNELIGTPEESAYMCPDCGGRSLDHHRPWMMRRGVWCPQGATVIDSEALRVTEAALLDGERHDWNGWSSASWVDGKPDNEEVLASFQLSSTYALSLSWRDVAKEYVESKTKPELMRNFVNQWMGQTFATVEQSQTWEELGDRMLSSHAHQVVPAEHSVVVCTIDKQETHYVWLVESWGPGRRSHIMDYGIAESLDQIENDVVKWKWQHELGHQLKISLTLVDRGFRPKDVDEWTIRCRKEGIKCYACRGSSTPLKSTYSRQKLGKDSHTPGMRYIMVDTLTTQDWVQSMLHSARPPDEGSCTLFHAPIGDHQDLLEQLLNESPVTVRDRNGKEKQQWEKVHHDEPNDYRDLKRYALVAMLIATRGTPLRSPRKLEEIRAKRAKVREERKKREDGITLLDRPGGWVNDWRQE